MDVRIYEVGGWVGGEVSEWSVDTPTFVVFPAFPCEFADSLFALADFLPGLRSGFCGMALPVRYTFKFAVMKVLLHEMCCYLTTISTRNRRPS